MQLFDRLRVEGFGFDLVARSYRLRLSQYSPSEGWSNIAWRQQIDLRAEQLLKFYL